MYLLDGAVAAQDSESAKSPQTQTQTQTQSESQTISSVSDSDPAQQDSSTSDQAHCTSDSAENASESSTRAHTDNARSTTTASHTDAPSTLPKFESKSESESEFRSANRPHHSEQSRDVVPGTALPRPAGIDRGAIGTEEDTSITGDSDVGVRGVEDARDGKRQKTVL